MIKRRMFLASGAAALAMPALARAESESVLRFVPQADLSVLDPVWTTTYQTRDHGFLVFDTLFGLDDQFRAQPQMAEGARSDDDGKRWTITLRDGLKFQDNTPVLARDCAASVKRWGARDAFGQALMAATDEISAPDDKTLVFQLKRPFPLLPDALAKTPPSMCPIMPERLASTDPYKQVTEMVGSGPYRYIANERVSGSRVVYERFAGYVPRRSGGRVERYRRAEGRAFRPDRVADHPGRGDGRRRTADGRSRLVADAGRGSGCRCCGKPEAEGAISPYPTGYIATMRFNQLSPPFDNPAVRRAMLAAVTQADYMTGDGRAPIRACGTMAAGIFCPGTPMASDAGMAALTGPRDLAPERAEEGGIHGREDRAAGADRHRPAPRRWPTSPRIC